MAIRKLISGGCVLQANMDAIESVARRGADTLAAAAAAVSRLMSNSTARPDRLLMPMQTVCSAYSCLTRQSSIRYDDDTLTRYYRTSKRPHDIKESS